MGRHPAHLAGERRVETRHRILAAAHEIVAADGYAGAEMELVARRAGVATGTIYRHFRSKADLLAEVFGEAAGREQALIAGIVENHHLTTSERLAEAVEVFARRALAAPQLSYALMAEPVDPAVEAARLESKRAYRDVFARLLEEGVASSEIEPLDAPVVASALVGALQEALIGPLAERHSGDALIASLVSFALRSAGARDTIREEIHGHR
jgi:AcrR family transcriptional regulator